MWYLPFTNSPRKHTVTYHFSDLQKVYNGNCQIHTKCHTKCQLQYLHPPHISTSGKCHCVIIHQTTKATEYIGRCQSICTSHYCHIYAPISAFVTFTPYKFDNAPQTLTWQSLDLVQCHLHDWCTKDCAMVHITDALLLIGKSTPCSGSSRCRLSLSEWSSTICPTR